MSTQSKMPDPMLLSDGTVVVFTESGDEPNGYESQHVGPDDDDYAYWVGQAQAVAKPDEETSKGLVNLGYVTAIFMPLIGFVLGIVVVTRSDRRVSKHGARIIALSIIVFIVAIVAITASVNRQAQKAQQTLTTELDAIQQKSEEEQAALKRQTEETDRRIEGQGRESEEAIQRASEHP